MAYRRSEREKAQHRAWYHRHRDVQRRKMKEYRTKIKDACFGAYGGYVCACCGVTEKPFLTIDHANDDGAKHRKEIGYRGGIAVYLWLYKNAFPPGFQVLCFNCNHGRYINGGICPHQEAKQISQAA